MTPLITAIFMASVLGSFHCAGMCGAFLAIAIKDRATGWGRAALLQGAYHGGRLISYTAVGAAAGAAGKFLNIAGALAGIRPVAAILAGAAMVTFGLITLLQARGISVGQFALPASWMRFMQHGHRIAMQRPPLVRALSIGLLTTLLPCGWLYAFAVTAAGTGSPLRGALAMAAFWAGTLPMLVTLGVGVRGALGPLGRRLPVLTVVGLIVAGLFTLSSRAALDPMSLARKVDVTSTAKSPDTMNIPAAHKPPCCEKP